MNPLAEQLNQIIKSAAPHVYDMLSDVGKKLFFPKGILSQSAEAKEKAHAINATIGIATEDGRTMRFDSVMASLNNIRPSQSLTYAPSFGIPALRKQWQTEMFEKNPSLAGKTVSLPVVSCGITHGIATFADVWTSPGDVIILPEMMWGNYSMIFSVRKDARIRHYELFTAEGEFNLGAFEQAVRQEAADHRKITVVLNFPQNPSGYTVSEREADGIVRILTDTAAAGTYVLAVTDDAYFGLFYEPETLKESLFARLCGAHPGILAVKLDGATKENYVWGLRVGFITYGGTFKGDTAPLFDALERKTAGCIRGTISNASHLSQTILLNSMQNEKNAAEKKSKFNILMARAKRVKTVSNDSKYAAAWEVYPFNSGYFMCIRLKTVDAETLRVHLLDRYGVGLISLGESNLRVAFSCMEEADVEKLFDTIFQGVKDLEKSQ
ncbi:aminotransferase class I/II-fold pyridoxal phosphate-dependent enzyme [uncultured Desulfosarcina sp.]|uniref:aminotransferase class I/II-fold pyridoxal phosphate-dependent enzyme n=1 Tax=uncultured Desulfosarcina sp. TaxID=218289 RepID=UPI0029C8822B|nr:aminotransferase class I/II-fold pyridoxal phosphate-dependent enzyme [uncultured Desulfosarcina sp.]